MISYTNQFIAMFYFNLFQYYKINSFIYLIFHLFYVFHSFYHLNKNAEKFMKKGRKDEIKSDKNFGIISISKFRLPLLEKTKNK